MGWIRRRVTDERRRGRGDDVSLSATLSCGRAVPFAFGLFGSFFPPVRVSKFGGVEGVGIDAVVYMTEVCVSCV